MRKMEHISQSSPMASSLCSSLCLCDFVVGNTLRNGGRRNKNGAGDGIRTHDNDVGNVVLYQLSYTRSQELRVVSCQLSVALR